MRECSFQCLLRSCVLLVALGPVTQAVHADHTHQHQQQFDRHHDLVIYGATPGGVACAVRAAREGLNVLLLSHTQHPGGMFANGLSTMDTLYNGARAPLYDEFRQRIYDFYREKYGEDSAQYRATRPGYAKTRYEAHVAEQLISELLAAEQRVTLVTEVHPVSASREGSLLQTVTFQQLPDGSRFTVSADVFADCSYEADLAAVAGVPYRVGRESREEFQEPHAGVIYMRNVAWPPRDFPAPSFQQARELNLVRYNEWFEAIDVPGSGAAHPAVQGYNLRTVITKDPDNRVAVQRPDRYDAEFLKTFGAGNPEHPGLSMPNQKFGLNAPKLVGQQDPYVEGDWSVRQTVFRQHREATLGLLYFRQHDPSVPTAVREAWQQYGLPRDEFAANGHVPYEIYARETRRIRGRTVFTEHDARLAAHLDRAPVHPNSISITEWFLDSHACTPQRLPGSEQEGKVMLKNQTFPGQVAYRTLLPKDLDNLLVPVCLSATHVGWGTIRLEPTWMSIGEAAAFAVVLAKRQDVSPAAINIDSLVRLLAERRIMITFFNDIEGRAHADWYPAVQYLGTRGYFTNYSCRPDDPLTRPLAEAWTRLFRQQILNAPAGELISEIRTLESEKSTAPGITAVEFLQALSNAVTKVGHEGVSGDRMLSQLDIPTGMPLSRGNGCRLIDAMLMRFPPKQQ